MITKAFPLTQLCGGAINSWCYETVLTQSRKYYIRTSFTSNKTETLCKLWLLEVCLFDRVSRILMICKLGNGINRNSQRSNQKHSQQTWSHESKLLLLQLLIMRLLLHAAVAAIHTDPWLLIMSGWGAKKTRERKEKFFETVMTNALEMLESKRRLD